VTDWTPDEERVARALEPDAWLNRDVVFSEDIETGLRVVLPSIHAARRAIAAMQPRWRDVKTDPPQRDGFDDLVMAARAEAARAMLKFPQPNYVISKIAEEAGEVVKAAIHCAEGRESYDAVHSEMRQLIAMLYRLWVEGDGVHGLQPVCPPRLLPPLPPAPETNREE